MYALYEEDICPYLVHVKVGVDSILLETINNFFDNINVSFIDLKENL